MQSNPDLSYQMAVNYQRNVAQAAACERATHLFPSRPWLDAAMWSALLGPIIGFGFVAYFARVILVAVSH